LSVAALKFSDNTIIIYWCLFCYCYYSFFFCSFNNYILTPGWTPYFNFNWI